MKIFNIVCVVFIALFLAACSKSNNGKNFDLKQSLASAPTETERIKTISAKIKKQRQAEKGAAEKKRQAQIVCLGDALHYEARPNATGYASVAEVIFARAEKSKTTVCNVVYAFRYCKGRKCKSTFHHARNPGKQNGWRPVAQFSYITEGHPLPWQHKNKAHRQKWAEKSLPAAKHLYSDWEKGVKTFLPKVQKAADGATHYHAHYVKPSWRKKLRKTGTVAGHHFYKSKETAFAYGPKPQSTKAEQALDKIIKN